MANQHHLVLWAWIQSLADTHIVILIPGCYISSNYVKDVTAPPLAPVHPRPKGRAFRRSLGNDFEVFELYSILR